MEFYKKKYIYWTNPKQHIRPIEAMVSSEKDKQTYFKLHKKFINPFTKSNRWDN